MPIIFLLLLWLQSCMGLEKSFPKAYFSISSAIFSVWLSRIFLGMHPYWHLNYVFINLTRIKHRVSHTLILSICFDSMYVFIKNLESVILCFLNTMFIQTRSSPYSLLPVCRDWSINRKLFFSYMSYMVRVW